MSSLKGKAKKGFYTLILMDSRKQRIMATLVMMLVVLLLNVDASYAKPTEEEAWKAFVEEYRVILGGVAGLGALTSLLIFIIHFVKLGAVANNPAQRSETISNMVTSGICTALLGGAGLVAILYYDIMLGGPGSSDVTVDTPAPSQEKPKTGIDTSKFAPDDTGKHYA